MSERRDSPNDECQIALETFLCGDDSSASMEHIDSCPECAPIAEELARDQERLRRCFAETVVPPALELRDGLHSASGYPRRVSLTLMPFFMALLLLLTLLLIFLAYFTAKHIETVRFQDGVAEDLPRIQTAIAVAIRGGVTLNPNGNWQEKLLNVGDLLDPLDQPYRIRIEGGKIIPYSIGQNGIDESGTGDDISGKR